MKKTLSLITLSILSVVLMPSMALAAKPTDTGASKPPASTPELAGYDISYPQCGKKLPTDQYFGIVGVNGGTAATTNACLAEQLLWAGKSKTGSSQPKLQ